MNLLSGLGQTAFEWTWKTSLYTSLLIVLVFVLQTILAKWLTPRLRYTLSRPSLGCSGSGCCFLKPRCNN